MIEKKEIEGKGIREIVVMKDGKLIEERYGKGFREKKKIIGW